MMTVHRPVLLLTRPRAASDALAEKIAARLGDTVDVVVSPLIEIVYLPGPLALSGVRGLIFTSGNGVEAAAALTPNRDLPAYCVGPSTTRRADAAGWRAEMAGPDARSLVLRLKALRPDAPLLHLRGRHARGDIVGQLGAAGLPVREQIVYDQRPLPLSQAARARLQGLAPVIVPLFSPRSARLFAEAGPEPVAAVAAISHAVAEALPDGLARRVAVAEAPNGDAMLSLLEKLAASVLSG